MKPWLIFVVQGEISPQLLGGLLRILVQTLMVFGNNGYLIFSALQWLPFVIRHRFHHKCFTELGVIPKKSDMSSDLKLRVKVCGVNISWGAWVSTVQRSEFKACLLFDWVFWAIKSCCWPDDEKPDAYIVSREESVHLYKGRPQLDTHGTLSNWPGLISLDTARIILMGDI